MGSLVRGDQLFVVEEGDRLQCFGQRIDLVVKVTALAATSGSSASDNSESMPSLPSSGSIAPISAFWPMLSSTQAIMSGPTPAGTAFCTLYRCQARCSSLIATSGCCLARKRRKWPAWGQVAAAPPVPDGDRGLGRPLGCRARPGWVRPYWSARQLPRRGVSCGCSSGGRCVGGLRLRLRCR